MWVISQDRKYIVKAKVLRLDGPLYDEKGETSYRIVAIPEAGIEIVAASFESKEEATKAFEDLIAEVSIYHPNHVF